MKKPGETKDKLIHFLASFVSVNKLKDLGRGLRAYLIIVRIDDEFSQVL